MIELKPCPICGRKPKIHYWPVNTGWAKCKPSLGKTHLIATVFYVNPSKLEEAIILEWNKEVDRCAN